MIRFARSVFVGLSLGLFFSLWLGMAFHVHKEHTGDLHAHHADCKVCVFSSGVSQKFLQASGAVLSFGDRFYATLEFPARSLVFLSDHLLQPSRAPPL